MAYKCKICGTNDVEHSGGICELCAIGQDPYAIAMQGNGGNDAVSGESHKVIENATRTKPIYPSGKGRSRKILLSGGITVSNTTDSYNNSIVHQQDDSVQIYQAGQVPINTMASSNQSGVTNPTNKNSETKTKSGSKNKPLTYGITKNISVDSQDKSFFQKVFRTLTQGVPYTFDNKVTMFQVFPDYSGTALNAMGNACDQVVVYGRLNSGAVSENNEVEIYGRRDSNNNIIAKEIYNKATGTTVIPEGTLSAGVVWGILIVILLAIGFMIVSLSGSIGEIAAGVVSLGMALWTVFLITTILWGVIMCFTKNKLKGKIKWYLYVGMFILILLLRMV